MRNYAHTEDMNTILIVATAALVIVLMILIIVIYNSLSERRRQRNPYQNQRKKVLVKNGVDVKKQVLGGEKGEYFTGNLEERGTRYVNLAIPSYRVVFDNLNTRERLCMKFTRQMWIGRADGDSNEKGKLKLSGDEKISRNHCMIYENGGILYLQDLNSRNHTYLNGKVITDIVCLQNGDVIQVGDTQLRLQYSIISNRPT